MNTKSLLLALMIAVPLVTASPVGASAPVVSLEMTAESYSALETLGGAPPVAVVSVTDDEGEPVAGAEVRVVFIRQVRFVGFVSNETFTATTGADGTVAVPAGDASSLPGDYYVIAFAAGTSGSDRYSVTT